MWPFQKKVKLHGFDLAKWTYLGYSLVTFKNERGQVTSECYVHFFEHKFSELRKFKLFFPKDYEFVKNSFKRDHSYISIGCENWRIGEHNHADFIKYPSSNVKSDKIQDTIKEEMILDDE